MASKKLKVQLSLEGASEYKNSLANIRVAEKELQAELKKTQAQYKGSEKSLDALNKKEDILSKSLELAKEKYKEHSQMVQSASSRQIDYANKTEALKKILDSLGRETGELTEEEKKAIAIYDDSVKSVEDLKTAIEKSEAGYEAAGRAVKTYQTAMTEAETEIISLNGELIEIDKEIGQLVLGTEEGAEGIEEIGDAATETKKKTEGIGGIIKANLASEAIIAGAKALAKAIKEISTAAVETGAQFEASMSKVAATMGMTADEIAGGSEAYKILEDAAKKCGETTMYSASEAAEALNYLALAGYDAAKAAETLPKVLDLAAAGGIDLATASDMVTDAMAALGMETSELDNYIDEMAVTAQKSNTSVAQLGEATLVCAGTVKTAGMDIEDMNTALGVLANNGIKGEEGGTKLRNVILSLSAPTEKAATKLKELGVETEDAHGNMRNLEDIMKDLNASIADMGTAQKAQAINTIFNKTDISAVNALLKSTNGEYSTLKGQIEKATGAASNMAKTMNDNLKGQVTILKSNLEALGISAYQVFDKELKKGVEEASESVQRLNESVANGEMHTSLNRLSESLGELINKTSNLGEKVLPDIINGAAWFIDNLDVIASLITGVGTAHLVFDKAVPLITAVRLSWEAYKKETEFATISQWLLNTAMNANPAVLLATAVTGLAAGITAYNIITKTTAEEVDHLSDSQRKLVDESNKLIDSCKEEADARRKTLDDMAAQRKMVDKLKAELKGYIDENGRVVSSEGRVKEIVDELNTIIPELGLSYDETTRQLSFNTEELDRNTDALLRQAEAAAVQEQLTAILKEKIEVETELQKMEEEYNAAVEKLNETVNEAKQYQEDYNNGLINSAGAAVDANQAYRGLAEATNEAYHESKELFDAHADLEARLSELSQEQDILTGRINETNSAMSEQGEAAGPLGDIMEETAGQIKDSWEDAHDSIVSSIQSQISLFDEYKEADKVTKEQILKNMYDHVEALQNWSTNLQSLSKMGISEGLLQELSKMGPEGAQYVAEFASMSSEQLTAASKMFDEAMMIPEDTMTKVENNYKEQADRNTEAFEKEVEANLPGTYAKTLESWDKIGEGVPTGVMNAISREKQKAINAAEEMAIEMIATGHTALEEHSPSKVFDRMGTGVVEGMTQGVLSHIRMVNDAVEEMTQAMMETARLNAGRDSWFELGYQAGEGLVDGLNAMIPEAEAAAARLAAAAEKAAKAKLQINSPSKVFEQIGEYTGEGFIGGFEESVRGFGELVNSLIPEVETPAGSSEYIDNSNVVNNINIYGTEYQNVDEIAQAVHDIINNDIDNKRATYR